MSKRFLLTLIILLVISIAAGIAIFLVKGYRFSSKTGTITGTGILSVNSKPDQASVYLDNHLTIATNANINSLVPKDYEVKIVKEGYIPWQKNVSVKEGLVTDIKATLFPAIPTVYPLTYSGVEKLTLSPDRQRAAYIVLGNNDNNPNSTRKNGIWVWEMSTRAINLGRGNEPHQVVRVESGLDFSKAILDWSPDSNQIMVTLPDRSLILDAHTFNDNPQDITAILSSTLRSWEDEKKNEKQTKLQTIADLKLKQEASSSSFLKWSDDETKIIYSLDGKKDFKTVDLANNKTYNLPQADFYTWHPESDHIIIVEKPTDSQKSSDEQTNQTFAKISVIEFDGLNKAEIYAGYFDPNSLIVWPDSSRITIVSSLPTQTASNPNLFGINLK